MSDAPRAGRGLRIALFVSLALNLAAVGLIVGVGVDRWREGRSVPAPLDDGATGRVSGQDAARSARDLGLGPYLRALPLVDQRAIGAQVRDRVSEQGGPRAMRREMRQRFREALAYLRAEPFDAAGFAALLDAQSASAEALRATGQAVLVARLAAMTPEARIAYADALESALRRARPSRGD